jgi:tRNA dimethylallyltransferase
MDPNTKLVAIVGQTATGKSEVALEMAERFGGEIICADSRTVYRGMDIGTAKPSSAERERVRHHCLDMVDPNQTFSAYDFQKCATKAIAEIRQRGNIPFVVGGTGLYINGLMYSYEFGQAVDRTARTKLEQKPIEELQKIAMTRGIDETYGSFSNRRHLSGAILRSKKALQKKQLLPNVFMGAIQCDGGVLSGRISTRVETMLSMGLVDEVRSLVNEYGPNAVGLSAPMYKAFTEHILGNLSLDEATERAKQNDRQLAKRQLTWFKRDQNMQWVQSVEQLKKEITLYLTKI